MACKLKAGESDTTLKLLGFLKLLYRTHPSPNWTEGLAVLAQGVGEAGGRGGARPPCCLNAAEVVHRLQRAQSCMTQRTRHNSHKNDHKHSERVNSRLG